MQVATSVSGDWGIYVKSIGGEEIAINADQPMDTMSIIKLPLMVDAFRLVDAGKLDLGERITMQASDKRFGTGVLRTLEPGLSLTLRDAVTLMIIQSDNTSTDMIFHHVGGPEHVTGTMESLGLRTIRATGTAFDWFRALGAASDPNWNLLSPQQLFERGYPQSSSRAADVERFHFEGKTPFGLASARDIGRLLEMIARGQAATKASCEQMAAILRQQQMNTRIPKYIAGARVGHKTGDFPPYIANDAGLIEADGVQVVAVFFNAHHRGFYSELEDAVARMSADAWHYFAYRR